MATSSANLILSTLPLMGLLSGLLMALSPRKAARRMYKFDDKEVKDQTIDLIRANGASALSVAVAEMTLSYTDATRGTAVALAMIPRALFLVASMAKRTKFGSEMLTARSLVKILLAIIMIEGGWLDPARSIQARGGFYALLGLMFTLAPEHVARDSDYFDSNPATLRCLRARGKTDVVFGSLVWSLATMSYAESVGVACAAWFAASVYSDFIVGSKDRFRSDAFAQLLISSASAAALLMNA